MKIHITHTTQYINKLFSNFCNDLYGSIVTYENSQLFNGLQLDKIVPHDYAILKGPISLEENKEAIKELSYG